MSAADIVAQATVIGRPAYTPDVLRLIAELLHSYSIAPIPPNAPQESTPTIRRIP